MSDLFGAGRPSTLSDRCQAVKSALDFGDVAAAVRLSGSSRDGWDCPACGGERTLQERSEDKAGGRCKSCGEGFDIVKLVGVSEDLTFPKALNRLEQIRAEVEQSPSETGRLL